MKLADPIDRAVAAVGRRQTPKQSPGARMVEEALAAECGAVAPLVERVARIIYSYDCDSIDRPWGARGPSTRQTFFDIAEEVLAEVRRSGGAP